MSRSFRVSVGFIFIGLLVGVSFAGGQYLRRHSAEYGSLSAALGAAGAGSSAAGGAAVADIVLEDPRDLFLQVQQHVQRDYVDPIRDPSKLGAGAARAMLMSLDDAKTRYYDADQRKAYEKQLSGEYAGIGAILAIVRRNKGGVTSASAAGAALDDAGLDDLTPQAAVEQAPHSAKDRPAAGSKRAAPAAPRTDIEQRRLVLQAPVAGGPAAKAGLRAGDVITEIDGRWVIAYDPRLDLDRLRVRGMSDDQYRKAELDARRKLVEGLALPRALELLTTGSGKDLKLAVDRAGLKTPLVVTLKTALTHLDPVQFREINASTAYLRVTQFGEAAASALAADLRSSQHRNLVIDLRDNAGGSMASPSTGVYGAASALVANVGPPGPVATLVTRGNRREVIRAVGAPARKRRVAVLINGGTGNIAEAVAAALRGRGAAVIGTRTAGDGALVRYFRLHNGGAMTLNSGRLLTTRSAEIAGAGLQPDIAIGPASSGDPALDRAVTEMVRTTGAAR